MTLKVGDKVRVLKKETLLRHKEVCCDRKCHVGCPTMVDSIIDIADSVGFVSSVNDISGWFNINNLPFIFVEAWVEKISGNKNIWIDLEIQINEINL